MSGFPDISSVDDYGGLLADYDPVVDPTTDREATAMNQALVDTAAMTQTAGRAWCRIVLGSAPALANPNGSGAGWGNSVPPVPTHPAGNGAYVVTWPATVTDALGNTKALNFTRIVACHLETALGGPTFGFAQALVLGAYSVGVAVGDHTGTAADLAGVVLYIEVG